MCSTAYTTNRPLALQIHVRSQQQQQQRLLLSVVRRTLCESTGHPSVRCSSSDHRTSGTTDICAAITIVVVGGGGGDAGVASTCRPPARSVGQPDQAAYY